MTQTAPYEQSITFFHTSDLEATTLFYKQLGLLSNSTKVCVIFQMSKDGFVGLHHQKPAATEGVIITLVTPQ